MPKGVFPRTKPAWNKGKSPYSEILDRINDLLMQSYDPLTLGDVFNILVDEDYLPAGRSSYKMIQRLVEKWIDKRLLKDGRGLKNRGLHHREKGKFKIGDKVRIKRFNNRTPQYLIDRIRLDTPRTIVSIFKVRRVNHYHLGTNGLEQSALRNYAFRPDELIPFQKGNRGRPRAHRLYKYHQGTLTNPTLTVDTNQAFRA